MEAEEVDEAQLQQPLSEQIMEYAWLEPKHDPIVTDTNLAEIDFEDFRNEDLAYAFSCGEEESGGSSTDMSICRSEALFSSMRDSEMQSELLQKLGPRGSEHMQAGAHGGGVVDMPQDSLIQDSLAEEDFNFSEQVKVNKNNYTLTYSGQGGAIGSFIASMVTSGALADTPDENNGAMAILPPPPPPPTGGGANLDSPGKLTTWLNVGKQTSSFQQSPPQPILQRHIKDRAEENSINNNGTSSSTSSETESRKSRSLPDFGREHQQEAAESEVLCPSSEAKLVNAFIRGRSEESEESLLLIDNEEDTIPMMRSKDTVNHFLKTNSRLTSIEERAEGGYSTSSPSSGSDSAATLRTSPPQQLKKQHRKHSSSSSSTSTSKFNYPDLNFLENDVGLWDAFFLHGKNNNRFQSVLKPPLPVEEYLQKQQLVKEQQNQTPPTPQTETAESTIKRPPIHDSASLRALLPTAQKHLVPLPSCGDDDRASPITQVCQSMSRLHTADRGYHSKHDRQNQAIKSMFNYKQQQQQQQGDVQLVKVREAWAPTPEHVTEKSLTEMPAQVEEDVVVVRRRTKTSDRNLNLLNNNGSVEMASGATAEEINMKRRSYHPQDYLSKVLEPVKPTTTTRRSEFPKSGSQNDICDSWRDEPEDPLEASNTSTSEAAAAANSRWTAHMGGGGGVRAMSAEYPFQKNLCMPPQGINFDLTHKRGLFVTLYSAVERLLLYQDDCTSATSARYVLFHELCPALHAIMHDGLKPEVITSFGRMHTSVWRVVEAVTRAGHQCGGGASTADLVMLLNAKFAASGEDHRKFAGFVAGLLNMSSLHVWYTKLKWSMDVLLRFYERHAFICALHKETRLLFDELIFCLQRLYAIPLNVNLPFTPALLDDIPSVSSTPNLSQMTSSRTLASSPGSCSMSRSIHGCLGQRHSYQSNHGCSNCCSNCVCTDGRTPTGDNKSQDSSASSSSGRRPVSSASQNKSRIPRPISLPKRLEAKLSKSPSPARANKRRTSPSTGPVRPTTAGNARKSRVRDTIRLFDSKASSRAARGPATTSRKQILKSPKTGAGESMAMGFEKDTTEEH